MQRGWMIALVCLGFSGFPAHADRIELTSGDILLGTVVHHDDLSIQLDHPVLGRLTFRAEQIQSMEIDDPGAATGAPVLGAQVPRDLSEAQPVAPVPPPTTVENDAELAWKYQIALGFTTRDGQTSSLDLNGRFRARHKTDVDRFKFESSFFYGESSSQKTREDFHTIVQKDWLMPVVPEFLFAEAGYDHDDFKQWEHRANVHGGLGYNWRSHLGADAITRVGAGISEEMGGFSPRDDLAPLYTGELAWQINTQNKIEISTQYQPNDHDYRLTTVADWTIQLSKTLGLQLGLRDERDTAVAGTTERNDTRGFGSVVFDF